MKFYEYYMLLTWILYFCSETITNKWVEYITEELSDDHCVKKKFSLW